MSSFSAIVVNEKGQRVTIESPSFGELQQTIERLKGYGYNPLGDDHFNSRGVQSKGQRQPVHNTPPNVAVCPYHPEAGMGHDKNNPGEYYCRGKVGGRWCGYKASKEGVVRHSILRKQQDEEQGSVFDEIDF